MKRRQTNIKQKQEGTEWEVCEGNQKREETRSRHHPGIQTEGTENRVGGREQRK